MTDIYHCDKKIAQAEAVLRSIEGLLQQHINRAIERRLLSGKETEVRWA
jgi:hypothetical protein